MCWLFVVYVEVVFCGDEFVVEEVLLLLVDGDLVG